MSRVGRLGTTLGASRRCIGATRSSLPLALLHGGVVRDEWANNAPLRLSRRCQTMKRNLNPPLHCVSRKLGDEECIFANIKDQDVDANNNNSATTTEKDEDVLTNAAEDASEAEAIVVDITAMEAALLEKRLPSTLVRGSVECLNPAERRSLTKLIYDAFYKSLATSTDRDEAAGLMYQAGLELQWLEEWAAQSTSDNTRASLEERRRKVKMAALERVDLHKPLSYIIGSQPFFGCTIGCEAPLLCPRPETEMWAHWLTKHHLAKANKAGARVDVLDMCCGTGCIGVSLAKNVPSAHVFAVDLLESAVLCSLRNAEMNGISSSRYTAVHSDMFDCFCEGAPASPPSPTTTTTTTTSTSDEVTEAPFVVTPLRQGEAARFDVVVSNPPYVLPEQYENLPRGITLWESKMALVGDARREHQQYRYFQELTERGAELLKRDADRHPSLWGCPSLVVEVGLQARLVASLMERSGRWREVCVHLDYAQQERWISAILA